MSSKRNIGNQKYLKKRIPQNPRYQHVKSRLDTGSSLTKEMERLEEIKKNYRYRKDELFKRLKVTTFAQLVLQVASVTDLSETSNGKEKQDDSCGQPETDVIHFTKTSSRIQQPSPEQFSNDDCGDSVSPRSTLQSVISGVGELDLYRTDPDTVDLMPGSSPDVEEKPYPDCPYLLLDVRERDLYDQCHIISALSYPIATLSRTINPFTMEVLNYKNVIGKIIIVYDEDERLASQAASTMCERGFENLFMLSGGLKVLTQKFPNGMTTGLVPVLCLSVGIGHARSNFHQGSETEKKWRFTAEDLQNIQNYLEHCLISPNPNSRLNRMSTGNAQLKSFRAEGQLSISPTGTEPGRTESTRPWK
ncbi:centrosomal protein of 41 kDa [Sardina pilchardus]|uniref:centrosomal protein of 41 kDa n=1 Tax=Sardina pilchardus TaxID=27697 RepID=UPI002E0DE840